MAVLVRLSTISEISQKLADDIALRPAAIFKSHQGAVMLKEKCLSEMSFNSNTVVLQSCLGPHVAFYRLKKTSLFGRDSCNNHTIIILISFLTKICIRI